ncbi:hypothetical protein Tco_1104382 [Tanacetum coccineum]
MTRRKNSIFLDEWWMSMCLNGRGSFGRIPKDREGVHKDFHRLLKTCHERIATYKLELKRAWSMHSERHASVGKRFVLLWASKSSLFYDHGASMGDLEITGETSRKVVFIPAKLQAFGQNGRWSGFAGGFI